MGTLGASVCLLEKNEKWPKEFADWSVLWEIRSANRPPAGVGEMATGLSLGTDRQRSVCKLHNMFRIASDLCAALPPARAFALISRLYVLLQYLYKTVRREFFLFGSIGHERSENGTACIAV